MKNKEKVILLVGGVILLLVLATFFSYAYFAVNNTVTNNLVMNVTIESGESGVFTATKGKNIELNVTSADMLDSAVGTVGASQNTDFTVSLQSKYNIKCTYDLYWVWNSNSDSYAKTANATREFTIRGVATGLDTTEKQLNNYNTSTKIGTYTIIAKNTTTTHNWNFTTSFYNLNEKQDNHVGKSYSGKVEISPSNVRCMLAE